jgi:hypothetical protein
VNPDTITLIGAIATLAGLIGLGITQIWANHVEARLDDEDDE